jgi:hypothetical protein
MNALPDDCLTLSRRKMAQIPGIRSFAQLRIPAAPIDESAVDSISRPVIPLAVSSFTVPKAITQ